jgi:hypothetical protein
LDEAIEAYTQAKGLLEGREDAHEQLQQINTFLRNVQILQHSAKPEKDSE